MIAIDKTDIPNTPGVYFFYDEKDTLIYIGKSINIRKRIQQHFSGKDRKSIKIQLFTKRVSFEVMGSELIALLYESDLIKKHQPLYNRSQRRTIYQYGLYLNEDKNGYKTLQIDKIKLKNEEITSFSTVKEAKDYLFRITEKYNLCQKLNGLYKTSSYCFQYHIKECNGACMERESPKLYNQRVEEFLNRTKLKKFTKLFNVEGRNKNEIGLVYIENGIYKGFGYCSLDTPKKDWKHHISPRQDNKDVRRILMRYVTQI